MAYKSQMNIYLLNKQFERVDILENYISFIWTDKMKEYGDFEFYTYANKEMLDKFNIDWYIQIPYSDRLMVIKSIEIESDEENGDKLKVQGYSLEHILTQRIIYHKRTFAKGTKFICDPDLTGTNILGIRRLLNDNILDPKTTADGTVAWNARKLPDFIYTHPDKKTSEKEAVNDWTKYSEVLMEGEFEGSTIYDQIKTILDGDKALNVGFKVLLNSDKKFEMSFYTSTDRSIDQSKNEAIIASAEMDTLLSCEYVNDKSGYKNTTLIKNNNGKTAWYPLKDATEERSGYDRYEVKVDGESTEEAQLSSKGKEKLAEYAYIEQLTGKIADNTAKVFEYHTDYEIGDLITIQDKYGHSGKAIIKTVTINSDENGITIYPTFEYYKNSITHVNYIWAKENVSNGYWINLEVYNKSGYTVIVDFEQTLDRNANSTLFGSSNNGTNNMYYGVNGTEQYLSYGTTSITGPRLELNRRYKLKCIFKVNNQRIYLDDQLISHGEQTISVNGDQQMYLFDIKRPDAAKNWFCGKVYSVKIFDNDSKLIKDFSPCVMYDGRVGLWEKIESKFHQNGGTKVFEYE